MAKKPKAGVTLDSLARGLARLEGAVSDLTSELAARTFTRELVPDGLFKKRERQPTVYLCRQCGKARPPMTRAGTPVCPFCGGAAFRELFCCPNCNERLERPS